MFDSPVEAARELAIQVRELLESRHQKNKTVVLGLATGSTPLPFYRELIRLHREESLSFRNLITFNLDEYYGLKEDHPESYARFMADQLYDHIDIQKDNIHIPKGSIPGDQIFAHCRDYEEKIEAAGGIDLQILGIGRTGHIGFNEPGSTKETQTRRITLDRLTRLDAAGDFRGEENVPRFAITMGVGTILRAKKIVLMAWGEGKAAIVARAVEKPVTDAVSASFLQEHANACFFIDHAAGKELTREKLPWLVGPVQWPPAETMRAVCWLSDKLNRPVLKITDEDYNEHGLSDLLSDQGPAYQLNIRIFNRLQHTITGWPGGKPRESDTFRPEKAHPYPKRCLVFSPEPQDALIAMGGTIDRLQEQGNEVWLICLTNGSLRVNDSEAEKFVSTLAELAATGCGGDSWAVQKKYASDLLEVVKAKGEFGEDPPSLRQLKGLVLRGESRDACSLLRIPVERVIFADLPFYENGRYRRFSTGPADVDKIAAILRQVKPHQIYLTGHSADPNSVPALTFRLIEAAWSQCQDAEYLQTSSTWLFPAKEKMFEPHEIDMAVPMSPLQLETKNRSINRFQSLSSQERSVPQQNRSMAACYDALGLAQYEAIECFRRWKR